jgi:hypothetical protein
LAFERAEVLLEENSSDVGDIEGRAITPCGNS